MNNCYNDEMRIDRALANSGLGSRSEIKSLIRQGAVSLGGQPILNPATQLSEEELPLLELHGEPVLVRKYLYYLLNKPAGCLTAMEDRRQPTIADYLPPHFTQKKISPVGRLDKDTTGLLLLTNDGELAHRLLSPRYGIIRRYYLEVRLLDENRPFSEADVAAVARGLKLNETETARPATLLPLSPTSAYLELTEGKFHEVKRMMHALAKDVVKLHRTSYGSLILGEEKPGEYRALTDEEILQLKDLTGLS